MTTTAAFLAATTPVVPSFGRIAAAATMTIPREDVRRDNDWSGPGQRGGGGGGGCVSVIIGGIVVLSHLGKNILHIYWNFTFPRINIAFAVGHAIKKYIELYCNILQYIAVLCYVFHLGWDSHSHTMSYVGTRWPEKTKKCVFRHIFVS
jgi:hypothetical protein